MYRPALRTPPASLLLVVLGLALPFAAWLLYCRPAPPPAQPQQVVPVRVRNWSVAFAPGEDCEAALVEAVGQAGKSVYVRADDIVSPAVAQALVNAKAKGRTVAVLLGRRDGPGPSSQLPFLKREKVTALAEPRNAQVRTCFAVIDEELLAVGGLSDADDECCLLVRDKDLAARYLLSWTRRRDALASAQGLN